MNFGMNFQKNFIKNALSKIKFDNAFNKMKNSNIINKTMLQKNIRLSNKYNCDQTSSNPFDAGGPGSCIIRLILWLVIFKNFMRFERGFLNADASSMTTQS